MATECVHFRMKTKTSNEPLAFTVEDVPGRDECSMIYYEGKRVALLKPEGDHIGVEFLAPELFGEDDVEVAMLKIQEGIAQLLIGMRRKEGE